MVKIYKENDNIYMEDGDDIVELNDYIMVDKKTGRDVIKLPENSANRQWLMVDKIGENGIELEYKATRMVGPRGSGKKLEDYLTDEERATIEAIKEACRQRKEADKPAPKSEIDKLRDQIAKYQAKIAKLQEEDAAE